MTSLRLTGIRRVYQGPPEVVALDRVSLTIEPGEFVAVVGPSGSGKSTLLNILGLLDAPTAGSYVAGGVEVGELSQLERARLRSDIFGFVFQSFHLQEHLSAEENVQLGLLYQGAPRAERRVRAAVALQHVGMGHRAKQHARLLSGGERQRVAIARAIVGGAAVIVADEPTGSLDRANSQRIVELLRNLAAEGRTVVLVTHDVDVANAAPRRLALRDGIIVDESAVESSAGASTLSAPSAVGPVRRRVRRRDVLGEAIRAIGSAPTRTATLAASLTVAVALIVALVGLTQTAAAQVSDRFDARRNREIVVTDTLGPTELGNGPTGDEATQLEQRALQVAGVSRAAVVVSGFAQPTTAAPRRANVAIEILGVTPALLDTVAAEVQRPIGQEPYLHPREALVGDIAAAQLDLASPDDRPFVFVNGQALAVVGVLENVKRQENLRSAVIVAVDDLQLAAPSGPTMLLVETEPGSAQQAASQLAVALDPVRPERFEIDAPRDPRALREDVEADLRNTMLLLGILAFVAAITMTMVVMTSSVRERYGEFGLRRAIGARSSHILRQVASEAFIVGVIGGVAGLILGLAAVLATTIARHWQPTLDLRIVPVALGSGVLASVLGGLSAARQAGRIQPIDALSR